MKLYITYARSRNLSVGRHAFEDRILYVGNAVPSLYDSLFNDSIMNRGQAADVLSSIVDAAADDIAAAKVIYVYVGLNAMGQAMDLIERLVAGGKHVIMTGCDCFEEEKLEFAERLGIRTNLSAICGAPDLLDEYVQGRLA